MWRRITVAFIVAPAIGVLAVSLLAAVVWRAAIGFFISAFIIAYATALLLGVPAFLLSRSWLPKSIWVYALAGAVVAAVVAVPMAFVFPHLLAFLSIFTGVVAGITFGLIVLPTSNNRWRGP
jgi:hypothetical protein